MTTVGRAGYMASMALAAALTPSVGGTEIHHSGLAPNLDLFGGTPPPRSSGGGFNGFKSTNKKHNTRTKLKTARKRQKQARKKGRGR